MADEHKLPDIYTDQVGMMTTDWGVILSLSKLMPFIPAEATEAAEEQGFQGNLRLPVELQGTVRMSLAHAKAMAILLKRMLKLYEGQSGEIVLPPAAVERHNITPEEWA